MRNLATYILKLVVMVVLCSYFFDFIYTQIHTSFVPKTKFQHFKALKNQSFDYVFLGSSRVENGISPEIIKNKTGKSSVNLGFQASKLSDVYLILQLLDAYHISYKKVFIQIDYIFNMEGGSSNILSYEILPFIHENEAISKQCLFNDPENFWCNKYLPFYRYCRTSQKNGIREVVSKTIKKKSAAFDQLGYAPLSGNFVNGKFMLPKKVASTNKFYNEIVSYAATHRKSVVFFTAPFRFVNQSSNYIQKLETKIPNLKNFSNELQNDVYFQNNNHLNHTGAVAFTTLLIEKLNL